MISPHLALGLPCSSSWTRPLFADEVLLLHAGQGFVIMAAGIHICRVPFCHGWDRRCSGEPWGPPVPASPLRLTLGPSAFTGLGKRTLETTGAALTALTGGALGAYQPSILCNIRLSRTALRNCASPPPPPPL